jgi:hypothetical protein
LTLGGLSGHGLARAPTRALRLVQWLGGQLRAIVVELVLRVGEELQIGRGRREPLIRTGAHSDVKSASLGIERKADHLHDVVVLDRPIGSEALCGGRHNKRLLCVAAELLLTTTELAQGELVTGAISRKADVVLAVHLAALDNGGVLAEGKTDGVHCRKERLEARKARKEDSWEG